jgi:hypothetical protein
MTTQYDSAQFRKTPAECLHEHDTRCCAGGLVSCCHERVPETRSHFPPLVFTTESYQILRKEAET